jgi:hypothetical protein
MVEQLTEEDFSKHLHTKFRVHAEGTEGLEIELEEVVSYRGGPKEQAGMERFSLFFQGPGHIMLKQHLFELEHEQMGSLALFLVPLGRYEQGFRYEAIFNYFKK